MILRNETCNDESLRKLLTDKESSDEFQMTLKHVDSCASCQNRLEQIAAGEELWDEAQSVFCGSTFAATENGTSQVPVPWYGRTIVWNETMASRLLSPPMHPEMLGRIGRYDVERLIGSGGMGLVFKAHDSELNRPVAIKLLAPYLAGNGSARKRFAREARAAAAVVDEHVVAIHNVESDDDPEKAPFLVMKYIAGGSLQQRLDREGPLEVREILRVGMQTAKGLAAAHSQGLIHRDIKPSNILLDEGVDRALLTDFGLARAENDACLTHSGFQPGTPHYMSPEQVRGDAIDGRSDLFGLGCLLYSMCTGHPPFRAESSYAVLRRIVDDEARSIREINPDIPEWLELIVMKLLAKSPDQRFESAESVAQLLEECLAHTQHPTVSPLPHGIAKSLARPNKRPPWVRLLVATMFLFLFAFAGVIIVLELNKGTLRIESDLDEVPISVMLGDKVVKKMTVTRSGKSVRVAAGKYVVRIDGEFEDSKVDGGNVTLGRGGTRTIRITQSANASLVATDQPLADLKLYVDDPAKPIAVGQQAQYDIRIRNRGSKAAVNVKVSGFFSDGIEPISIDNDAGKVIPGQVVLNPVPIIEAGQEVAFRVTARADKPGNHKFRVRLTCNLPKTELATEELTQYYSTEEGSKPQTTKGSGLNTPAIGVSSGEPFFMVEADAQDFANPEYAKLLAEHEAVRNTYSLACKNAKDDVELNRVYDELDPREIMPPRYLAFEEKYRGTAIGLTALTRIASMASSVGNPDSECAKGRAKGLDLILEHYINHQRLELFAVTLEHGPFTANIDKFLQTLVEKSPHTRVRANALLVQIKRAQSWLSLESPKTLEVFKRQMERANPAFQAEAKLFLKKLESLDFKQLRKDLNEKLDLLGSKYFDVKVSGYQTAGNAARRISHVINNVVIGKPAPELEAVDLDGNRFRLSELQGKNVVLIFAYGSPQNFAKNYAPVLQMAARFRQAPVRVVMIISGMNNEQLKAARKKGELNWTVIPQPTNGPLSQDWGIEGYPWAYIIDSRGILHPKVHMPNWGAGGYDASKISEKLDVLVGRVRTDD